MLKNRLQSLDKSRSEVDKKSFLEKISENIFSKNPDKIALIFDNQAISYAEVGERVAQAALALQKKNLQIESVVAICLKKSPEHIYIALACSLIGMIWLPIDMESPPSRLQYLLSNSLVDIAVTDCLIDNVQNLQIHNIFSSLTESEIKFRYDINRTPAYYLYTSGSTGVPKCVVLNNQATENVLKETIDNWELTSDDVIMAITPFHHDMSVFDIFATMVVGATLVIPSFEQSKDALAWTQLVQQHQVSIWSSVPAIIDMLISVAKQEQLKSLRLIAQGGDYIKPLIISKLRQLVPNARLFSLGGPTETTIWSIWHEINELDQQVIPYGKPLVNNQYYILNEDLIPCQVGEIGTMYMTGVNLSNGYLINGKLNDQDFIKIKVSEEEFLPAFRMSDLGYLREDQNIIFAGREAGYLKIRGVRISAIEVENTLLKHPSIQQSVVVSCTDPITDTLELVALYTLDMNTQEALSSLEVKFFLKRYLPSSHIPNQYLIVDEIPLTRNNKIDRNSLQKIAQTHLYFSSVKTSSSINNIRDSVLKVFRDYIQQNKNNKLNIFYKSKLLDLGIKPKQFIAIADELSQEVDIKIDFYTLISCSTIEDVVNKIKQQIEH